MLIYNIHVHIQFCSTYINTNIFKIIYIIYNHLMESMEYGVGLPIPIQRAYLIPHEISYGNFVLMLRGPQNQFTNITKLTQIIKSTTNSTCIHSSNIIILCKNKIHMYVPVSQNFQGWRVCSLPQPSVPCS